MRIHRPVPSSRVAAVTVVIPCYNYGHFLEGAVSSVLSQERVDARVIVVDDASPDGSAEVAQRLGEADPRVSVVVHPVNQGHIATYNDGLARVKTEYVALLSADDLLAPGALARATDLLAAHPRVGMVYGLPEEFESDVVPSPVPHRRASWTTWPGREWLRLACWRGRCFILSPEVVMRTEALRQVGPYNAALPHSGDLEYWIRTAACWDIGRVNGPVHAFYRVHGGNMHLTSYGTIQLDLRHRLDAFRVLSEGRLDPVLPGARRLGRVAGRGIGREALLLAARNLDGGGDPGKSAELFALAAAAHPSSQRSLRGRGVVRRLHRASVGAGPSAVQKLLGAARNQVDRVRWTLWRKVGIS